MSIAKKALAIGLFADEGVAVGGGVGASVRG